MLHYLEQAMKSAPQAPAGEVVLSNISRRGFLKASAAGFAVAAFAGSAQAFERYTTGGESMPHGLIADPLVFVEIGPDGTVTIVAHRSEMGTGARTSLPMVLADENEAVARLSAEFGARTGLHFETLSAVAVGFLADNDPSGETPDRTSVELGAGGNGGLGNG